MMVPDELRVGVYSNVMAVWNSGPHDFTLDFAVFDQPQETAEGVVVPAQVVARVKVPPSVIFQIATAIAKQVTTYEGTFGPITPRPPDTGFTPEEP